MALAIESAMPLAPPSQVGTWVEGLVGEALAERTEQIADIERDDSDPEGTPSAMISIAPGMPLAGLGLRGRDAGNDGTRGPRKTGRPDQTALTRASGARGRMVTAPTSPMLAAAPAPPAEDSLVVVSGVPARVPRGVILAAGVVVLALGLFGARRVGWLDRDSGTAALPRTPAVEPHPAALPQTPPVQASAGWIPIMPLPGPGGNEGDVVTSVGTLPAAGGGPSNAKRWIAPGPSSGRAPGAHVLPESTVSVTPAGSPGVPPKAGSCDPPFWIDSDGTKRYNHNCTSP